MMLHGSGTPKRTVCFSNGPWISGLDLGTLCKSVREEKTRFKSTRGDPIPDCTRSVVYSLHADRHACMACFRQLSRSRWREEVPGHEAAQGHTAGNLVGGPLQTLQGEITISVGATRLASVRSSWTATNSGDRCL